MAPSDRLATKPHHHPAQDGTQTRLTHQTTQSVTGRQHAQEQGKGEHLPLPPRDTLPRASMPLPDFLHCAFVQAGCRSADAVFSCERVSNANTAILENREERTGDVVRTRATRTSASSSSRRMARVSHTHPDSSAGGVFARSFCSSHARPPSREQR